MLKPVNGQRSTTSNTQTRTMETKGKRKEGKAPRPIAVKQPEEKKAKQIHLKSRLSMKMSGGR